MVGYVTAIAVISFFSHVSQPLHESVSFRDNNIIGDFEPKIHTTLSRNISLKMQPYYVDTYGCEEAEMFWKIERADGETEVYIIRNHTYNGEYSTFPDQGISLTKEFSFCYYCWFECSYHQFTITLTDMRYDRARITGVVNLSECFSAPNTTITTTLRIQGVWYMLNV